MDSVKKDEKMASAPNKEKDALEKQDMQQSKDPESEPKLKYPKVVFFIIGNEFCERFSYYGMRTVLSLFLISALKLNEGDATVIYHVFAMLCYFFPVFGAVLADSYLGKFNTIAGLSVVYVLGSVVVSVASATNIGLPSRELTYLGLLLIAMGTGGIKPCVSAFGGDQFVVPQQARQLAAFFSVFYFSINAGSLISTWLTPELRSVACLGQPTCFPLAFGVPAVLMLVALVIFVLGKPGYKISKPQGNVLVDVSKCMWSAFTNRARSVPGQDAGKGTHWLDHADHRFSPKLRSDIRAMLRVLLLFVPLPIFWALYDQQGSRWTFQANNMNGRIGSWTIKPDQMQVVNPLLILLFLPLFEAVVYPALNKAGLLTRPLQKMATGGVIAAIAFIISAVLEYQLQAHYPVPLSKGVGQVRLWNALPCDLQVEYANESFPLARLGVWTRTDVPEPGAVTLDIRGACLLGGGQKLALDVPEEKAVSYHLYTADPVSAAGVQLQSSRVSDALEKASFPRVRVMYHVIDSKEHALKFFINDELKSNKTLTGTDVVSLDAALDPAEYTVMLDDKLIAKNQLLDVGGVYTILVDNADASIVTVIEPNQIHLLWLLPQYVVITVAEVMFSVTGLEFAFTQAPVTMKSVLTSAWLLTVAFGNLIVVLVTESRFFASQASEFLLFAGLMLAVMVVFVWLANRYTYVEDMPEAPDAGEDTETTAEVAGEQQMGVLRSEKPRDSDQ